MTRLGYGAMQLAGPGVLGPPKDRDGALAVLREAVASVVNHIDTSDFYGPHVTNQLIREALHPSAISGHLTVLSRVFKKGRKLPPTPRAPRRRCSASGAPVPDPNNWMWQPDHSAR